MQTYTYIGRYMCIDRVKEIKIERDRGRHIGIDSIIKDIDRKLCIFIFSFIDR